MLLFAGAYLPRHARSPPFSRCSGRHSSTGHEKFILVIACDDVQIAKDRILDYMILKSKIDKH
jgi:hypothetical protein